MVKVTIKEDNGIWKELLLLARFVRDVMRKQ